MMTCRDDQTMETLGEQLVVEKTPQEDTLLINRWRPIKRSSTPTLYLINGWITTVEIIEELLAEGPTNKESIKIINVLQDDPSPGS